GQHAAGVVGALTQGRKHFEHVVYRPAAGAAHVFYAQQEILADGQGGEDVAVLGHVAETLARDDIGRQPADLLVAEAYGAGGRHVAQDGLDGRRAAHAVAAEETDDLALAHRQRHALQDVALAVERVEIGDGEHQTTSCGAPRYASCTAALARMRSGVSWAI